MIEDKELRELFKIESNEHLQKLSDGLLRLEKDPKDSETIEEVFREAHSLKGAARMIGVGSIETIAHRFEDILGSARRGETVLSSDMIDQLYRGLDSIRRLMNEAVTGEPAGVNISKVLGEIIEPPSPRPSPQKGEGEEGESRGEGGATPSHPSEFKIETVRVDTRILDILMTQAGELAVTRTHIARRLSEIEEIITLWEEWDRKSLKFELDPAIRIPHSKLELFGSLLNKLKKESNEDSARLDFISSILEDGIRKIRLIPLSTIFTLYPRMVRDMAREQSKEVELVIEGGEIAADKRIIEEMKDPLMHMLRNSIDHGIEKPEERELIGKPRKGRVTLKAYQTASSIVIEVSDNGKGLDIESIKRAALKRGIKNEEELLAMTPGQIQSLIFVSGFSTSSFVTDVSGRGIGLDVVRKNVERLKGTVSVESPPGAGCKFRVQLPITLATVRVLIAEAEGKRYAVPVEYVETSRLVSAHEIFTIAGRQTITFDSEPVSVARLSDLLQSRNVELGIRIEKKSALRAPQAALPCIILSVDNERIGLLVDALVDEQEVVLKPLSAILKHVRNVSGATILATGEICIVLNPKDLVISARKPEAPAAPEKPVEEAIRKKSILLVEDSITTRTQEKRILEGAGYEVVTAVDGLDALNKLNSRPFDGVVSDILMPHMDGLTLTEKIRKDKRYEELPIVLVTSLASDEDKRRGMEAGASAYIAKPTFDQKTLLEILQRLI